MANLTAVTFSGQADANMERCVSVRSITGILLPLLARVVFTSFIFSHLPFICTVLQISSPYRWHESENGPEWASVSNSPQRTIVSILYEKWDLQIRSELQVSSSISTSILNNVNAYLHCLSNVKRNLFSWVQSESFSTVSTSAAGWAQLYILHEERYL